MKNHHQSAMAALFFMLFFLPLFSQENQNKLIVESVGLESDRLYQFDPEFDEYFTGKLAYGDLF